MWSLTDSMIVDSLCCISYPVHCTHIQYTLCLWVPLSLTTIYQFTTWFLPNLFESQWTYFPLFSNTNYTICHRNPLPITNNCRLNNLCLKRERESDPNDWRKFKNKRHDLKPIWERNRCYISLRNCESLMCGCFGNCPSHFFYVLSILLVAYHWYH